MKTLFMQLRKYGRVSLSTTDRGEYYTRIVFATPDHTEVRVMSANFIDPEEAILDGIAKCKEAVSLMLSLEVPK
jgi:transcriptional regulator with AAA-type ATPase domain